MIKYKQCIKFDVVYCEIKRMSDGLTGHWVKIWLIANLLYNAGNISKKVFKEELDVRFL